MASPSACLSPEVLPHYLRLKITVEIVLPESEPVIGYPMTQGFKLLPHVRIPFLDPGFNMGLSFTASGGIKPVTQTTEY
jgi:hypothetical protein